MGRSCPHRNPSNPNRRRLGVRSGKGGFSAGGHRVPILRVLPLRLLLLPLRLHFLLLHRLLRLPLPLLGVGAGRAVPLVLALTGWASGDTSGRGPAMANYG